ncbi:hypothetical protein HOF56_03620 [Candidatus Peribacteria bacterium]|jgi:hypothetical protein|nr:hypothetical protein [Candidatus Peribacteria bacterium]MBT4021296.1 hypothetical protein [Candidatus Peribacteria bacterium]MBT4241243.1 hypothetical protein [Candidatus Peribacteria bacterium]MBT4474268.1 hypothetical protein [Candidatus Peribacteria bacterium]
MADGAPDTLLKLERILAGEIEFKKEVDFELSTAVLNTIRADVESARNQFDAEENVDTIVQELLEHVKTILIVDEE